GCDRLLARGELGVERGIPGGQVVTRPQPPPFVVEESRHAEARPTPRMGRIPAAARPGALARGVCVLRIPAPRSHREEPHPSKWVSRIRGRRRRKRAGGLLWMWMLMLRKVGD